MGLLGWISQSVTRNEVQFRLLPEDRNRTTFQNVACIIRKFSSVLCKSKCVPLHAYTKAHGGEYKFVSIHS